MDTWYWKASKTFADKIIEMAGDDQDMIRRACKAAKKCGANPRKVVTSRSFGVLHVVGFVFKTPPDLKVWKKLKNCDEAYGPRNARSKECAEIRNLFDDLRSFSQSNVEKLVMGDKSKSLVFRNGGLYSNHVGYSVVGKEVYLVSHSGTKLLGCKRISDIEFEKKTAA